MATEPPPGPGSPVPARSLVAREASSHAEGLESRLDALETVQGALTATVNELALLGKRLEGSHAAVRETANGAFEAAQGCREDIAVWQGRFLEAAQQRSKLEECVREVERRIEAQPGHGVSEVTGKEAELAGRVEDLRRVVEGLAARQEDATATGAALDSLRQEVRVYSHMFVRC